MPEFCTCGAQLPEDARFCHKCGKPQREEPVDATIPEAAGSAEEPSPAGLQDAVPANSIATLEAAVAPPAIGWKNRFAVRAAILAGVAAFFVAPFLGALGVVGMLGSGVFSVYLYRRFTGLSLTMAGGAKLGWIAGLFMFLLLLLSFTITVAIQPEYLDEVRQELLKRSNLTDAEMQQIKDALYTPIGVVALLVAMFISSTLPSIIGGAVGAKLLGGRTPNQPHA